MRKVIYLGGFLFLGTMALTSCKKDYQCEFSNSVEYETFIPISKSLNYSDLSKSEAEDHKINCERNGGQWSVQ